MSFQLAPLLLLLVHLSSTIELYCPSNCTCTLEDKLPLAKCEQLPLLEDFTTDLNILQIENSPSNACPISEDLSKFPKLTKLQVAHCSVDICANSFKKLPELTTVTFYNATLNHLNPILFESNRHLKTVNLSSNPLRIWRHLMISASVEEVDLTNCNFKHLPQKAFTQILNLKKLVLNKNNLTSFKNSLPSSLIRLDLSDNELEGIPFRVIQSLENLTTLNLLGNPLVCSCDLKLIDKLLSIKKATFLRPDKCIVTENKDLVSLSELSIDHLCTSSQSSTPPQRIRRFAHLGRPVDLVNEPETDPSNKEHKYNIMVDDPVVGEFIKLYGKSALSQALAESTETTTEPAPPPPEAPKKVPIISNTFLYILIAAVFLMLILLIVVLVSVCCALKDSCADDDTSAASACAAKACEEACANSQETIKLMTSSRRCSRRKGTSCKICPSTISRKKSTRSDLTCPSTLSSKKSAQSDFTCPSTLSSKKSARSDLSCPSTVSTYKSKRSRSESCSDTDTIACDFSGTTTASTSTCTTFQRC